MARRSYQVRKLLRHNRKPAELLLVPMIDIFTVLVTFLLMTAVFSRTVILELKLPPANAEFVPPPPGLQLEIVVRHDALLVDDRNSGPLASFPNHDAGYDYDALSKYLQQVKTKFPDKTDATVLLEPDIPYDVVVQVMDRTRVLEVNAGLDIVQYELFPDVSLGDAPAVAADVNGNGGSAAAPSGPTTPVVPAPTGKS
jgi:biopolymer transport protein ExbD